MHFSKKEILWHVIGWGLYLIIRVGLIQLYPGDFLFRLKMDLLELPLKLAAFYFAVLVLIQQLLAKKKYRQFALTFAGYLVVITLLNRLEDLYLLPVQPITSHPTALSSHTFWDLKAAFLNLMYVYPAVGLGISVYIVKDWLANQVKTERLAREKTEAELENLKKQIHPHFLFNTLNNIYALTLTNSPQAPETLLRLSEVLSYMIYDCESPWVPLQKDWGMIRHYIELEKLRLGNKLDLDITEAGVTGQQIIAPLLLISFVENAFKHGNRLGNAWVKIDLKVEENTVHFQIENTLPDYPEEKKEASSGVGLNNVRKRLELLYPDRFKLQAHARATYVVHLQIQLTCAP